jgi:hypothetical protein
MSCARSESFTGQVCLCAGMPSAASWGLATRGSAGRPRPLAAWTCGLEPVEEARVGYALLVHRLLHLIGCVHASGRVLCQRACRLCVLSVCSLCPCMLASCGQLTAGRRPALLAAGVHNFFVHMYYSVAETLPHEPSAGPNLPYFHVVPHRLLCPATSASNHWSLVSGSL